jgi:hypothetical protein
LNVRFPTAIRASGIGLTWNIGFARGDMMSIYAPLVSAGPAQIPMSLSIFAAVTRKEKSDIEDQSEHRKRPRRSGFDIHRLLFSVRAGTMSIGIRNGSHSPLWDT